MFRPPSRSSKSTDFSSSHVWFHGRNQAAKRIRIDKARDTINLAYRVQKVNVTQKAIFLAYYINVISNYLYHYIFICIKVPLRPEFNPRPVHMGFLVITVITGHVLPVLQLSLVTTILPMLTHYRNYIILATDTVS
jgi:hypothetical protein